jgi:hypothetical protein
MEKMRVEINGSIRPGLQAIKDGLNGRTEKWVEEVKTTLKVHWLALGHVLEGEPTLSQLLDHGEKLMTAYRQFSSFQAGLKETDRFQPLLNALQQNGTTTAELLGQTDRATSSLERNCLIPKLLRMQAAMEGMEPPVPTPVDKLNPVFTSLGT